MNDNGLDRIYCPVCDYQSMEFVRDQAYVDFDCPGCSTRKLSEFISHEQWLKLHQPTDPADWWKP